MNSDWTQKYPNSAISMDLGWRPERCVVAVGGPASLVRLRAICAVAMVVLGVMIVNAAAPIFVVEEHCVAGVGRRLRFF